MALPKPGSDVSAFDTTSIGMKPGSYAAAMSADSPGCTKFHMQSPFCFALCVRAHDPIQCLRDGTFSPYFGDPSSPGDLRYQPLLPRWIISQTTTATNRAPCRWHRFTAAQALCAFSGTHIALMGDSLMRNVFRDLSAYLVGSDGFNPEDRGVWKSTGDFLPSTNPSTDITMSYWWSPCVLGVDVKQVVKDEKRSVCARTEWDVNADHSKSLTSNARHESQFPRKLMNLFKEQNKKVPQPQLLILNFGIWQTSNAVNGTAALEYWIQQMQLVSTCRVALVLPWRVRYSFNPIMNESSDEDIPARYKPPVLRDIARRLKEICERLPRCVIVDPW